LLYTGAYLQFDWLRSAGATLSFGTGPSVDHTTGTDAGMMVRELGCTAPCWMQLHSKPV